jgi:hypothetical protein
MNVRPFDWRDLSALHRFRQSCVMLDSALLLTRGPMLVSRALLSYLAPSTGIFTSVCDGNAEADQSLIGQVIHQSDSQFAHLTFLTPDSALDSPALSALLEYLLVFLGERGAFRLLADVDEPGSALEALREAGFAIYTRQRIWKLTNEFSSGPHPTTWRMADSRDMNAIHSLYNNLIPGLVQQVEPFPNQRPRGLIFRQAGDLLAYVEMRYGHRGIWVQPFFHPDMEAVLEPLKDLLHNLTNRYSRPVYICIRSYQSWLEPAIEELGAEAGPRQAVMVKHLAVAQKAARMFALPALEGGHPEVSAPIARSESKNISNGTT